MFVKSVGANQEESVISVALPGVYQYENAETSSTHDIGNNPDENIITNMDTLRKQYHLFR